MTKKFILISLVLLLSITAWSQTPIHYSYDGSGNRIKRGPVNPTCRVANDSTTTALNSQELKGSKSSNNKGKNKGQNNNDNALCDESTLTMDVNPNPSSGKFAVFVESSDSEQPQNIEVYNALGKVVYRARGTFSNQHNIDISQHPKGVYFIKLYDGDNIVVEKVVYE